VSGKRRIYRKDPIQQAFCELRFSKPESGWAILPGQLYDRLRDEYPTEPKQDSVGVNFGPGQGAPGLMPVSIQVGQGVPGRVRLLSRDETEQVVISTSSITISCSAPYQGWEQFRQRISRVLDVVGGLFVEGFDIGRIGVRYVNEVQADVGEIGKLFGIKPVQFDDQPLRLSNFVCRSELPVRDDDKSLVIVTFASAFGKPAVVLDLDAISQNLTGVTTVPGAMEIVDRLRVLERDAFEASITDDARLGPFGGFDDAK
jgi:uncharacterized protein (TIGR04255 family)